VPCRTGAVARRPQAARTAPRLLVGRESVRLNQLPRGGAETRAALGRESSRRPEAYSWTLRVGSDRGRRDATGLGHAARWR
jgi:hypothetical protein